ncbi:MAG: hypothetical protein ACRYHA_00090 [Janthinobacterium lividum]
MYDRLKHAAGPQMLKPGEPMLLEPDRPWVYPVGDTEPVIDIRHRDAIIAEDDESYMKAREAVWKTEKHRLGGNLWNGIVHAAERLEWDGARLVLHVGRSEYKDIVFKNETGWRLHFSYLQNARRLQRDSARISFEPGTR